MSESNAAPSEEPVLTDVPKEEFVQKKAFEEVTKDMHKYKNRAKEESAKATEFEARLKAMEEDRMLKNEQYKELSEQYKAEAVQERNQRLQDREQYIDTVKRSALKQELGANLKDAYLVHANVNEIEVTENGTIDSESLKRVANDFRQEHGGLLSNTSGPNPTSIGSNVNATAGAQDKSLDEMSLDELSELLRLKKLNRS